MAPAERIDLIAILQDGQQLDARDDCLRLLRALPWASAQEKLDFWRQLSPPLRYWLSPVPQDSHQGWATG